jgi:chorismate mutase
MTSVAATDQPADATPATGITELRARIDEIDAHLIQLWRERADLSQQVGTARVQAGGTRLSLAREREVLDRFHTALGPLGTQVGLLLLRAGRGAL